MKHVPIEIETSRLKVKLESPESLQERIAAMPAEMVAELLPDW